MKSIFISIIGLLICIPVLGQEDDYIPSDEKHQRELYYQAVRNANTVTRLFIDRDIFNQIPKTIIHFKNLEKLECHTNTALTEEDILLLKSLPNLKDLDIHGKINELPANLGLLSKLERLRLHTKMTKIPDCVCELSQLRRINMVGGIQTLPPCFAKMDSLRSLNFHFNNLTAFPEVIFKIPKLDSLIFSAASLTTIPAPFRNMKIQYLEVSELKNNDVANEVFQLPNLKYLDVNQCKLNELPSTIRMPEVEEVVFSGSDLLYYDQVFQVFSRFKNLKALSISGANFNILGPDISKLTSLEKLTIIHSSIKSISPEFYSFKKLKYLKLSGNNKLPGKDISNLSTLEYLELAEEGNVNFDMESITALKKLKSLSLTDLGIKYVPSKIGDLSNLVELNISNNKINTLPPEIGKLSNLEKLKLGENPLSKLPSEMGGLIKLEYLSLPATNVSSLPASLYALKNIKMIIASKSFSSGTIKKIKRTFGEESLKFPAPPNPRL